MALYELTAIWVVALHHHIIEYPMPAKDVFERIGTALVNGSWLVRQTQPFAGRLLVVHGHQHINWVGRVGELKIASAPSPFMEPTDAQDSYFLIHTVARSQDGKISLGAPQRVDV